MLCLPRGSLFRKSVKVIAIGEDALEIVLDVLTCEALGEQTGDGNTVEFDFVPDKLMLVLLALNSLNFERNLDLSPILVIKQLIKLSFKLINASSSTFSAVKKNNFNKRFSILKYILTKEYTSLYRLPTNPPDKIKLQ